jgi:large subunit ribosomal protein L13
MHTIDAEGKKPGRIATQAAVLLMGKNLTTFVRNAIPNTKVSIIHASKLDIDPRKLDSKIYENFSGYPGGRKETTMKKLVEKKGNAEVLRKAVRGMLPANKLRDRMMKNLIITE